MATSYDRPETAPRPPDRVEPGRAEPSRAEPSRAEPSRAEPSRRAGPNRAGPSQAGRNRHLTVPSRPDREPPTCAGHALSELGTDRPSPGGASISKVSGYGATRARMKCRSQNEINVTRLWPILLVCPQPHPLSRYPLKTSYHVRNTDIFTLHNAHLCVQVAKQ